MGFFCSISPVWYPLVLGCWLSVCSCGLLQSLSCGDWDTTVLSEAPNNQGGFIRVHLSLNPATTQVLQKDLRPVVSETATLNCFFIALFLNVSLPYISFYLTFPFVSSCCSDILHNLLGTPSHMLFMTTWECKLWYPIVSNVLWRDNCHFWQWTNGIPYFLM